MNLTHRKRVEFFVVCAHMLFKNVNYVAYLAPIPCYWLYAIPEDAMYIYFKMYFILHTTPFV